MEPSAYDGFKLPIIVNNEGALLAVRLTQGHIDDRKPVQKFAARLHSQQGVLPVRVRSLLRRRYVGTVPACGRPALGMAVFLTVKYLAYLVVFQGDCSFIRGMDVLARNLPFSEVCANAISRPPR